MPFDYPRAGGSPSALGLNKEAVVLKPYKVTVDGHETTLLLSDADAKAQGLLKEKTSEPAEKQAPKPANKARTAKNKAKG